MSLGKLDNAGADLMGLGFIMVADLLPECSIILLLFGNDSVLLQFRAIIPSCLFLKPFTRLPPLRNWVEENRTFDSLNSADGEVLAKIEVD